MSIVITNEKTIPSAWSDWSSWRRMPDDPTVWESCRTREVTHTWTSYEVTAKSGWSCPSDYVYVGNGECKYWTLVYPDNGMEGTGGHPSTVGARPTTTYEYGPKTDHEQTWTETQCRHMTVFRKWIPGKMSPYLNPLRDKIWQPLPGLRMVQGDRLIIAGGKAISSISVNGARLDQNRTIETAHVPAGDCVIDVQGTLGGIEQQFQVVTTIEAPLRFVLRDATVTATGESAAASTRIENHSHGSRLVRVQASAVPSGWAVELQGSPLLLLGPGQGATLHLRIRAMTPGDLKRRPKGPLPVTLRATAVGEDALVAEATLYLSDERPVKDSQQPGTGRKKPKLDRQSGS